MANSDSIPSIPGRTAALATILALAGRAAAHGGEHAGNGHPYPSWLPPVAVLGGLVVVTGTLYADHRNVVPDRAADVTLAIGALGVVLGIGALVV